MFSPVIGVYDLRLVLFSALVSLCSAYATLEILDHIAVSTTWRRAVWVCIAALTSALGIWSMQCMVTLSLHHYVFLTYDVQIEATSFFLALAFSLLGAVSVNARAWGVRRLAVGGVLFGFAMLTSDALGVRAMLLTGHPVYRLSMLLAALTIALAAATVALLMGSRLQRLRAYERVSLRFVGSVLFAAGCMACYFYLISGVDVAKLLPLTLYDPTHMPLALALGLATLFLVLGAVAAVWLDDHASSEHKRAHLYSSLYTRERHVSATLQKALLPVRLPQVAGVAFSSVYLPHRQEAYVGGDWYDAFLLADGRIAFSMGDVAGHGLDAALTMNVMRHALRACAVEEAIPHVVLQRVNRILSASDHPAIVTAVFAVLDLQTSVLEFASAGHPAPLVFGADGSSVPPVYGDPPIGVLDELVCASHRITLPAGALVVFYTDGCTEYDRDILWGEQRLATICRDVLLSGELLPAKAICDRLFAKCSRSDDVAIFCVQLVDQALVAKASSIPTVTGEHYPARLNRRLG